MVSVSTTFYVPFFLRQLVTQRTRDASSLSVLHPACQVLFGLLWFIGLVLLCVGTIRAQFGYRKLMNGVP